MVPGARRRRDNNTDQGRSRRAARDHRLDYVRIMEKQQ